MSQQNVDIHAYSITEHAFLCVICIGSFNALKRCKIWTSSDLSWF